MCIVGTVAIAVGHWLWIIGLYQSASAAHVAALGVVAIVARWYVRGCDNGCQKEMTMLPGQLKASKTPTSSFKLTESSQDVCQCAFQADNLISLLGDFLFKFSETQIDGIAISVGSTATKTAVVGEETLV